MSMNIVLYVNSFLPNLGGKEIVVHYLARELHRLGNNVRVIGPSGWIKHRKHKFEYSLHRWPTLKGLFTEKVMYAQLYLDTRIWSCDVIHAHTSYPNGYIASHLKRISNLPLVITPHGNDIHMIPEIGFGQRLDPVKGKKIEFALKQAEVVTAISDSVKSSLLDAGCEPGKIRNIPNGIDIERFKHQVDLDVRQWLDLETDSRVILTVGNYHRRKGQDVLLAAMPHILAKMPKAILIVVGANQGPLAEQAQSMGLGKHIRLTGPISFPCQSTQQHGRINQAVDMLAALYRQSDVYVSASINKEAEGLSLAMLDAMAAGE